MTEARPDLSQSLLLQTLQEVSALGSQIGNLQGQANIIIKEQERAAEGRRLMHDKLGKIDTLAETVARIAPLVDAHEKKHNQASGAMLLGKTLWVAAAGAVGAAGTMLIQWLTGGRVGH